MARGRRGRGRGRGRGRRSRGMFRNNASRQIRRAPGRMFFSRNDFVLAKWVKDDEWNVARIISVHPRERNYTIAFMGFDGEYRAEPYQLVQLPPLVNPQDGEHVYAFFTAKSQWMNAEVVGVAERGQIEIQFDGFDKTFIMNPCVVKRAFVEGQRVLALWKNTDTFIPAEIASIDGETRANVLFDNKEKEFNTHVKYIVPAPEFEEGDLVEAFWVRTKRSLPAQIVSVLDDGKYEVKFDAFDKTFEMHGHKIKLSSGSNSMEL